ncbi:murein biosynthesis integral membrane protein MurJ [Ancylobacter lacus]|uniref:murein biosynthesis integral membrane protein MurJ n=1 Tax=Ancylobacter lacus TaxID=2579970 RepID=UPI001BCAE837|nr:lipid II flippase MurJ [Ancylobacter lacus]MBS7539674.1 polysaccharide biosynthesis C-terminal domain-containing protein [Ancylobacter lacus]
MSLLRHASAVAVMVLGSRILGFARDAAVAALFGAGAVADAAVAGLAVPQLARRLLGEGALNGAVVPALLRAEREDGTAAARRLAFGAAAVQFLAGLVVAGLLLLAMPQLVRLLAPGFAPGEPRFDGAVWVGRLTVLCLPMAAVAGVLAAIANASGRMSLPSLSPLIGNIAVLAVLGLAFIGTGHGADDSGAAATAALGWLAAATVAGAAAQLALQMTATLGCRFAPDLALLAPSGLPSLVRAAAAALPTLLGAGPSLLAAALPALRFIIAGAAASGVLGGVSALFYASRLVELPLGVIAAVAGAVLLPVLAQGAAGAAGAAMRGAEAALALSLPAAIGLALLAEPIVVALFRHGAFDAEAVTTTSLALELLALTLPFQALEKILAAVAFAQGHSRLVMGASLAALLVGALAGFALAGPLGLAGPALGLLASSLVGLAGLAVGLRRRRALALDTEARRRVPRLALAAAAMGACVAGGDRLLAAPLAEGGLAGFGTLGLLILVAVALYVGVAHLAGGLDLRALKAALRSKSATA